MSLGIGVTTPGQSSREILSDFDAMESKSLIQSKEFPQAHFLSRDWLDIIT